MENTIVSPLLLCRLRQFIYNILPPSVITKRPSAAAPILGSDILDIWQCSKYLGCSIAAVHYYKNVGIFPFYLDRNKIYFKKSEIDSAVELGGLLDE